MKVLNWIKEHKLLVVLVLIGSILRFYKLDFQSPWIDEIFTLYNSSSEKSFSEESQDSYLNFLVRFMFF